MKTFLLFFLSLCLSLSAFSQAVLSPNLAAGKPTKASSVQSSAFASDFAVDRNYQSRWASDYSNQALADAQWLYVDLQATYTVTQVRINWERAYGKDYEVQISADAQTWRTLRKITGNTELVNTITGLSGAGQYVRINCLARGTGYGYSILELEITNGNTPPTIQVTQPANNSNYDGQKITLAASATDADGLVKQVAFYGDGQLLGVDSTSPYSYDWLNVPTGTHHVYAVATDDNGGTATAPTREIYVSNGSANKPPTVVLTSPQAADYYKPASITLTADASDPDGTIRQVAFYASGTLLNVDTTAPYTYTWTNGATGVYDLTAVATDNGGATTTSVARRVRIVSDPPVVTITSPAAGATVAAPVTIAVNASDPDGTVAQVEIYSYDFNSVLLATLTTPPYAYTWSNATPGPHTILVRAIDNDGRSTSVTRDFIVADPANKTAPGRIEAENYDAMSGIATEPTHDVGGGLNVGYIDANDYLNYKVTATNAYYSVSFRVASWIEGAQLQLRSLFGLEGVATLATVTLPNTGGGQQWQTVTINNVTLINGEQTLQVRALTNGFNFNWLEFARTPQASAQAAAATTPTGQPAFPSREVLAGYPNPATGTFYLPGAADGTPVVVRDAVGNQVRATTLRGGAIDVQTLPAGLYLVQVGAGQQLRQLKMVKQ